MKHTRFSSSGEPLHSLAECSDSVWTGKVLEIFLWLIFLVILYISVLILLPAFDNPEILLRRPWQWYCFLGALVFSVSYFLFLLFSTLSFCHWRTAFTDDTLPVCTILVPAYNEGSHVYDTIVSLLASDYPPEKLRITAINDGSEDDTLYYLNKAKTLSPQITVIDLKKNQGKKHALYLGIKQSESDVIVTVDSDTIVRKDSLRQIVQPFSVENIGAVAGSIAGKNNDRNWHVRLLDVMLVVGCEFLRRAQSSSGNVFCTPGALSAYRRSVIMPLIDQWLNQTFGGQPAKIGEDRAIATLILCNGFRIVHQPWAIAETNLPRTYSGVCKMLIRWTRSDIRENIVMSVFVLKQIKKFSLRSLSLFIHWFASFVNMLLPLIFLPVGFFCLATGDHIIFQLSFIYVSAALWSMIPAIVFIRQKKSLLQSIWAFAFGLYWLWALSWISIYSIFTLHNSNWLTRKSEKHTKCP